TSIRLVGKRLPEPQWRTHAHQSRALPGFSPWRPAFCRFGPPHWPPSIGNTRLMRNAVFPNSTFAWVRRNEIRLEQVQSSLNCPAFSTNQETRFGKNVLVSRFLRTFSVFRASEYIGGLSPILLWACWSQNDAPELEGWRRGWDSNPRMEVLQTSPLGHLGTAPGFLV